MKKLLALLLALALVLSIAACGKKEPAADESGAPSTDAPTVEDLAEDLPTFTFTQYGKGTVTIVGSELTKDDYDEDLLRVYYTYTNNDDTAAGHYLATALNFVSITQDGQECDRSYASLYDEFIVPADLGNDLYVQPGVTALQTMLIHCDPDGGPVDVSCYLMVGSWMYDPDTVETFDFQVDLKDLMGAPKDFQQAPITNPTYTANMSASGPYDYPLECEVSIDGIELTKDSEGEDLLRVFFTVTNNDDETRAPDQMLIPELYQDGVGLPYASTWDIDEPTEEDEAYEEDLYPGETVKCSALFYPRNQNPVELVIESTNSDMRLGTSFEVKQLYEAAAAAEKAAADAAAAAAAAASAADKELMKEMVGLWDRTNSWPDHITFNTDLTGVHDLTGDLFPFTYTVTDGVVTLNYDDGEVVSYEIEISGNDMILTDADWGDELTFVRAGTDIPEETEEESEAPEETELAFDLSEFLIGTWVDHESGYEETFVFHADGTGLYSWYESGLWEFTFTYEVCEDDSVDIYYDDGDVGGFWIEVEDENTMLITNSAVVDMKFVRE